MIPSLSKFIVQGALWIMILSAGFAHAGLNPTLRLTVTWLRDDEPHPDGIPGNYYPTFGQKTNLQGLWFSPSQSVVKIKTQSGDVDLTYGSSATVEISPFSKVEIKAGCGRTYDSKGKFSENGAKMRLTWGCCGAWLKGTESTVEMVKGQNGVGTGFVDWFVDTFEVQLLHSSEAPQESPYGPDSVAPVAIAPVAAAPGGCATCGGSSSTPLVLENGGGAAFAELTGSTPVSLPISLGLTTSRLEYAGLVVMRANLSVPQGHAESPPWLEIPAYNRKDEISASGSVLPGVRYVTSPLNTRTKMFGVVQLIRQVIAPDIVVDLPAANDDPADDVPSDSNVLVIRLYLPSQVVEPSTSPLTQIRTFNGAPYITHRFIRSTASDQKQALEHTMTKAGATVSETVWVRETINNADQNLKYYSREITSLDVGGRLSTFSEIIASNYTTFTRSKETDIVSYEPDGDGNQIPVSRHREHQSTWVYYSHYDQKNWEKDGIDSTLKGRSGTYPFATNNSLSATGNDVVEIHRTYNGYVPFTLEWPALGGGMLNIKLPSRASGKLNRELRPDGSWTAYVINDVNGKIATETRSDGTRLTYEYGAGNAILTTGDLSRKVTSKLSGETGTYVPILETIYFSNTVFDHLAGIVCEFEVEADCDPLTHQTLLVRCKAAGSDSGGEEGEWSSHVTMSTDSATQLTRLSLSNYTNETVTTGRFNFGSLNYTKVMVTPTGSSVSVPKYTLKGLPKGFFEIPGKSERTHKKYFITETDNWTKRLEYIEKLVLVTAPGSTLGTWQVYSKTDYNYDLASGKLLSTTTDGVTTAVIQPTSQGDHVVVETADDGTKTRTTTDRSGNIIETVKLGLLEATGGADPADSIVTTYSRQPLRGAFFGTRTTTTIKTPGMAVNDAIVSWQDVDARGRVRAVRDSMGKVTTYTYSDANPQSLSSTITIPDPWHVVKNGVTYYSTRHADADWYFDPESNTMEIIYFPYSGFRHATITLTRADVPNVRTEIRPDNGTVITTTYANGKSETVTGTAIIPKATNYGVLSSLPLLGTDWHPSVSLEFVNGLLERSTRLHGLPGQPAAMPPNKGEYQDGLGRTIAEWQSFAVLGVARRYKVYSYKAGAVGTLNGPLGRLTKIRTLVTEDGVSAVANLNAAAELIEYDDPPASSEPTPYKSGLPIRRGIDLNATGTLNPGIDRMQGTDWIYKKEGSLIMRVTTVTDYRVASGVGNQITSTTEYLNSGGRKVMRTEALGDVTVTSTSVTNVATATVTTTKQFIGNGLTGIAYSEVEVTKNGNLVSKGKRFNSSNVLIRAATTLEYDDFGRLVAEIDGSGNQLYRNTLRKDGSIATSRIGPASSGVSHTYSITNSPGAPVQITDTDQKGNTIITTYDLLGRVVKQSGTGTYPVEYEFNIFGYLTYMKTWRSAGSTPDVTQFTFSQVNGSLLFKQDAMRSGYHSMTRYEYNNLGQLWKKTNAREIVTTYSYNKAGDLLSIDYGDTTKDVSYTYDPSGRVATVTDAGGLHTLTPDFSVAGADQEDITTATGLLNGFRVTLNRHGAAGASVSYKTGTTYSALASTSYVWGYGQGLMTTAALTTPSGNASAAYTYQENLDRVHATTVGMIVNTQTLDSSRRVSSVASVAGATTLAKRDYVTHENGQRKHVDVTDSDSWDYTYNTRGEILTATRKRGGQALPGLNTAYQFDDIGNRVKVTTQLEGDFITDHPAAGTNKLNQYTSISHPARLPVLGEADADAMVSLLTGTPSAYSLLGRQGAWYAGSQTGDNSSGPAWVSNSLKVSKPSAIPPFEVTLTGNSYMPPASEAMTYDYDGNLLTDGRWSYSWDAENRLVQVETNAIASAAGVPSVRVNYAYDAKGRRIQRVLTLNPGASSAQVVEDLRYLWQGWSLLAEVTMRNLASPYAALTTPKLTRAYLWGLDMASSLTATGNTGALAAIIDYRHLDSTNKPAVLAPCYDGNGNIIALADPVTGALLASYDYDAFGNQVIADTNPSLTAAKHLREAAEGNDWGFSTKQREAVSGLVYYGFRYYAPEVGRWLSRDPAQEPGGINLYEMCGNDTINNIDKLGLESVPTEWLPNVASIAAAKGWGHLAALFTKWFNNPMWVMKDGKVVGNSPYDDSIVSMDWVLGFSQSTAPHDKLLKADIFKTATARTRFKKLLAQENITGQCKKIKWATSLPINEMSDHWVEQASVGQSSSIGQPNALDAALHRFVILATVDARVSRDDVNHTYWIDIEKIGTSVRDQFEFEERDQYLGHWGLPNKMVYNPVWGPNGLYRVENQDFRFWRNRYNLGQDFFVLSKPKITDVSGQGISIEIRQ